MNTALAKLLFATVVFISHSALAGSPPDFPAPPDAQVQWVGRDMSMNGLPLQTRLFVSRKSPPKIARFYRKQWQRGEDGRKGYVETSVMVPWQLITRVEDGYLMTVQYQRADNGGTWGYLAISPLPDPKAQKPVLGKGIPSIPGSRVISDIGSHDVGQSGRTVQLTNNSSLASNVNFYRYYFNNHGWQSEEDRVTAADHTHLLSFKKWRQSVRIVMVRADGGTRVVVNRVSRDLL